MLGYPNECHKLCAYGATAKKHEYPKKCPQWWVDRRATKRWDIPKCVTNCVPMEERQKSRDVLRSVPSGWQIEGVRKVGISPEVSPLVCQWGSVKSRDILRNIYGDLLPDVIKSVTGFGRKSGNRHFAKRISPTRIYR